MSNSVPPSLNNLKNNSKQISLLKYQKDDGSWDITIGFCHLVGKSIMQVKGASMYCYRKQPVSSIIHQFPLFATFLALEILKRNLTSEDLQNEIISSLNWKEKAEEYIKSKSNETLNIWSERAIWLLDGEKDLGMIICDKCNTKRPKIARKCATCEYIKNETYSKKSIDEIEYSLDLNPNNVKLIDSISNVNWNCINGCKWIPGGLGSFGVIVIELNSGIVVGKCSGTRFHSEFMGYKLAKIAKLNVPNMRLIPRVTKEGQEFLQNISKAPYTNPQDAQRIGKYNIYPIFFIMEFIPSDSSLISNQEQSNSWLNDSNFIKEISKMMCFDILINNYDRIPLIWKNEGNPENVLIRNESNGNRIIYCIDQFVTIIIDSFFDKYENILKNFITTLKYIVKENSISNDNREIFSFFIEFFQNNLLVSLTDEHLILFSKSILIELKSLCNLFLSTPEESILEGETQDTINRLTGNHSFKFVQNVSKVCLKYI